MFDSPAKRAEESKSEKPACDYECSISDLVSLLETIPNSTPILVDFDETLFLRNSTQEYLNTLHPRPIGALFLGLMNYLKPWNWLPGKLKGEISRDWLKVIVGTLLFPWTLILWQWRAKQLAKMYGNKVLIELLQRSRSQAIIATLGFSWIVRPIIKHLPLQLNGVIDCRFWQGAIDRYRGKCLLVKNFLGSEKMSQAIAVTDSIDDIPLLSLVEKPCLLKWPTAKTRAAMADVYIPFFYLEKIKKPGEAHFVKQVLADELVILILAMSWVSPHPILHAISMMVLLLSLYCIYEIGYWENDLIGKKFEKHPVLSEAYHRYQHQINLIEPWLWATIIAIPGLILLQFGENSINIWNAGMISQLITPISRKLVTDTETWLVFLVLIRLSFWIFNHVDKQTRVWIYPLLQLCKCFGFAFVTATNTIGAMLFVAQVVTISIPYLIYRYSYEGMKFPKHFPKRLGRMLVFALLLSALVIGDRNFSEILNWQVLVITMVLLLRSIKDIWQVIRQIKPISHEKTD